MLMPVRCFTCGKVLGDTFERFVLLESKLRLANENQIKKHGEALDMLLIKRYCCRRMLMSHVDLLSKILRCGVQDQADLVDNGAAWWIDYEQLKWDETAWEEELERREREEGGGEEVGEEDRGRGEEWWEEEEEEEEQEDKKEEVVKEEERKKRNEKGKNRAR